MNVVKDDTTVLVHNVPFNWKDRLKPEHVRLVRLIDKIPKEHWYQGLKNCLMKVYFFPGFADAVSVNFKDCAPIKSCHFNHVKYVDGRNRDIRFDRISRKDILL